MLDFINGAGDKPRFGPSVPSAVSSAPEPGIEPGPTGNLVCNSPLGPLPTETSIAVNLPPDIEFLTRFGIALPVLQKAALRARLFNINAAQALNQNGDLSEHDYAACAAFELGLPFVENVLVQGEPFINVPSPDELDRMARLVASEGHHAEPNGAGQFSPRQFIIAPPFENFDGTRALLTRHPHFRNRLRVTTRRANMLALENRCSPALTERALNGLKQRWPHLSAKTVITVPQALVLFVLVQILIAIALFSSVNVLLAAHFFATAFYLGCSFLRLTAGLGFHPRQRASILENPSGRQQRLAEISSLPLYSVLVPLYREAGQVPDLVNALSRLDWPVERLEIKLICEADDVDTLNAVRTALLEPRFHHFALVEVPSSHPRTKPKALNYALPLCRGTYVVIYDAEDRPSPLQLREAHARFKRSGTSLACLQAPLIIYNHREGWFPRLFAIEYSALFDGLLPFLSRLGAPLPLGGTSNHFRREVLDQIGAWDPYNVTEDADLGIRISRHGYAIGVLAHPTFEEAPASASIWLKQRTRWFKGWYQTWLVHMRHPLQSMADLGWLGSLVFHLVVTGVCLSALVHPFLLAMIMWWCWRAFSSGVPELMYDPLFMLDVFTVLAGYLSFAVLGWRTLPLRNLKNLRASLWTIPAYWMMLSAAAWRALWHLIRRPHEWEKTPHRLQLGRGNFKTPT